MTPARKPKPDEVEKRAPWGPECGTCPIGGRHGEYGFPPSAGFMQPDGLGSNGVMMVAEALGHAEAVQEKPLIGPSGFLLGQALNRMDKLALKAGQVGIKRQDFSLANVVWCQPHENKLSGEAYENLAINHCRPNLDRLIEARKPKVILALGQVALRRLAGVDQGLDSRGYVFPLIGDPSIWVVHTYHPAYLLRGNWNLTKALIWDIEKALDIAREGYSYEDIECIVDPPIEVARQYAAGYFAALQRDPTLPLGADIETPYKRGRKEGDLSSQEDPSYTINRVSLSYEAGRGITFPWRMPYIPIFMDTMAAGGTVLFWNAPYDVPRLKHNGVIFGGPIRDSMVAWHYLYSDVDKDLGFATSHLQPRFSMWKHMSWSDEGYYAVKDAVALWRNDRDILQRMQVTGQYQAWKWQVDETKPILERASEIGVGIDVVAQKALGIELGTKLEGVLGEMRRVVPPDVLRLEIKKTLKGVGGVDPSMVVEVPGIKKEATCLQCGAHPVTKPHVTKKVLKVEVEDEQQELALG